MKNLTRREVLQVGSTTALTAILGPLFENPDNERENHKIRKADLDQAPSEEICLKVPFGALQVPEIWMQAEKMLILFEPALATKTLSPSAAGQAPVAVFAVIPAQRENARPLGEVPAR